MYSQWVARRGHCAGARVADAVRGGSEADGDLVLLMVVD
jgi:hypothetical protein